MSDLSAYAAKSKRASEDDVPRQMPMRPQSGIRQAPSTDQKKVRRAMSRGVRKSASQEAPVSDTVQREAALLSAMAKARPEEQARLVTELDDLRARRREAAAAASEMDFGARVVAAHLTPVPTHVRHSAATDWIDTLDVPSNDATLAMKTQATLWFSRTSSEVREDREEFAIQAEGAARRVASAHGEQMVAAERAFLDHVSHLYRTANDVPAVSGQNGLAESTITDYQGLAPVTEDKAFSEGWAGEPDDTGVHPEIPGAGGQTPPGPTSTSTEARRRTAAPYNGGQQVPVSDIKVGDVISGWADGTLTIAESNGRSTDSFRGKVTNIETERIDRSEANGGAYDSVSKITVQNLSGDTTWTVEPFLDVSKVTREAAGTTASRKTAEAYGWTNEDTHGAAQAIDNVQPLYEASRSVTSGDDLRRLSEGFRSSFGSWVNFDKVDWDQIAAEIDESNYVTGSKTATPGTDQNGNATSGLPDVTVHTNTDSKFPWELDENEPGTGAADVDGVRTPGGEAGYPQPTASRHQAAVAGCSCARNTDGSVTTMLCPVHATEDPCWTMAQVTGRRRSGSIVRGVCTNCGWTSGKTASRTAAAPTQQELDDQAEAEAEQRAEMGAERYREDRLTDYYSGDDSGDDYYNGYEGSRKTAGGVDLYALKVGDQVLYSRPGSEPLVMTVRREIESMGAPENRTVSLNLKPGGFSTEVSPSGIKAGYYDVSPVGTTATRKQADFTLAPGYSQGHTDGYNGNPATGSDEAYVAGYKDGWALAVQYGKIVSPIEPPLASRQQADSVNPATAQFRARVQAGLAREAGRKTARTSDTIVTRDGRQVAGPFSEDEAFAWLLKHQGQSVDWALKNEGYAIVPNPGVAVGDGFAAYDDPDTFLSDWQSGGSWAEQNNID